MSGIVFLKTQKLGDMKDFYREQVHCRVWLEQADCVILQHGNLLFGFCKRDNIDTGTMLTFFYDTEEEVNKIYRQLKPISSSAPTHNDKYRIYHFFARDPEERPIEFQSFNRPAAAYRSGENLLLTRRSIRAFDSREIADSILEKVLDISRFAPTSRNRQPYYFKLIKQKEELEWLAAVRGKSTKPIGQAQMAVAICADPDVSQRYIQDGCIAGYHFILTAWYFGLGTCWIAAMDREDVKAKLNIPTHHYVVTVTPLGYPSGSHPSPPVRKALSEYVRS